jgi:hypothetical protein
MNPYDTKKPQLRRHARGSAGQLAVGPLDAAVPELTSLPSIADAAFAAVS